MQAETSSAQTETPSGQVGSPSSLDGFPVQGDVEAAYQGRKTARQSSEHRRIAILQAALRVLVRDGVRGVRHRAVAAEAGVPLSATTYYFKDIHDLLADALTLFASEMEQNFTEPFWRQVDDWLQALPPRIQDAELLSGLAGFITEKGTQYILTRVRNHREQLLLEHAFWYAALNEERIHRIAIQHSWRLQHRFAKVLEYVGVREVELEARALLVTVRSLEYEGLINSPEFTADMIRATLGHKVRTILAQLPA